MANAAGGGKGARGIKEPSLQRQAALALQNRLPLALLLSISATGATTPENLAYASRLGLWAARRRPSTRATTSWTPSSTAAWRRGGDGADCARAEVARPLQRPLALVRRRRVRAASPRADVAGRRDLGRLGRRPPGHPYPPLRGAGGDRRPRRRGQAEACAGRLGGEVRLRELQASPLRHGSGQRRPGALGPAADGLRDRGRQPRSPRLRPLGEEAVFKAVLARRPVEEVFDTRASA